MIGLFLTVLALAVPIFVYAKYLSLKTTPLRHMPVEPLDATASHPAIASENLRQDQVKATPAAEPDNASAEVARRGDPAVQLQSPATRRPVPAVLPADETTDVTPHERQMLEAMKAATSEQFQYIRQSMLAFSPLAH
ncbi:hypothetical protein B0H16DRAFT_994911 [Mycena metata]|uniref:Uncharacterized protein n=1 Tax=Mycena metata TaxID=1033252 RepID=A0AAD7ILQ2_9AGAR|nr:hypothetical protein B0H16DRAFT_994911 [Mycena metata]